MSTTKQTIVVFAGLVLAWLILRFVVGGGVGEFLALVPLGYLLVRLFRRSSPLSPEQAETDDAETGEDEETRKLRKFGLL